MVAVHPHPFLSRFARALLATIFLVTGITRLLDLSGAAEYIASAGLPFPMVLAVASALVEVVGGLMLVLGVRHRLAALGLGLYLVIVTLTLHDFWTMSGAEAMAQRSQFLKNLAIIGGLFTVYAEAPVRVRVHEHHPPGVFPEEGAIRLP